MLRFTQGSPDEMQVWIACGIATYLIVFPLIITAAVVCAEWSRRTGRDGRDAAGVPGQAATTGPAHQRGGVAPARAPNEPGVETAA